MRFASSYAAGVLMVRKLYRVLCESILFSSRRRHTRSLCDWSSDVCSSDLEIAIGGHLGWLASADTLFQSRAVTADARSEERRVGKECRSSRRPHHFEKDHRSTARAEKRTTRPVTPHERRTSHHRSRS